MQLTLPDRKTENVFDRALDILREHGWCRGYFEDSRGRVCASGAVRRAVRDITPLVFTKYTFEEREQIFDAQAVLDQVATELWPEIASLESVSLMNQGAPIQGVFTLVNDNPTITQADIERMLRAASDQLESTPAVIDETAPTE